MYNVAMKRKYEIAVISRGAFARTVRIYAPKKADRAVIMHDGQNVFCDAEATYGKSMKAIETLKSCGVKNTAVIGVDAGPAREEFYMPFPAETGEKRGGKCALYCEYLSKTLLPYLDKRFGFKKYAMFGSSCGALATMYYASLGDERFKAYAMLSTPLFSADNAHANFLSSAKFDSRAYYVVYAGGNEQVALPDSDAQNVSQAFVDDAFALTNALRKSGATDVTTTINGPAVHDETAWIPLEREFFKRFGEI